MNFNIRQFRVQRIKLPLPRCLTQYYRVNFEFRIPTLTDKMVFSDESNNVLEVDFWITEVSLITSCEHSII